MDLGRVGIWWSGRWQTSGHEPFEVAAELEELGYSAFWSSGGGGPELSSRFERLLSGTQRAGVASGIVSIWASTPDGISDACSDLEARFPGRFVLGLGASNGPIVKEYSRPYSRMVEYLDALDRSDGPVQSDRRILAALGPRMLELARDRSAGAHPYFVPAEHTARARGILGPGPLLAPEVTVVLESDPVRARERARAFMTTYLGLPNYTNNLRTLGFGDEDLTGGGSDRVVDAVVGWGTLDAVTAHIRRHFDAGADHVCIQVLSESREDFPLAEYRQLASALLADH